MGTRMPMARALIEHGNLDKDHVLFDIQVAYDLVPDIWDLDHLGPVRAPYPEMFVEFALDHERDEITDGLSNAGFFIREHETSKGEIRLSLLFVLQKLDGSPGHTGVYTIFTLTSEGKLANDAEFDWVRVDDNISLPEQDIEMALEFLGQRMIPVALTALSLMNCRNVKTEKLGSVRMRRSGLQKRRGMKPFEVSYNTIILPGGGSQKVGSGGGAHHRASALHRVRGHTKTFTAEAPLLGKHVGTWWWGWNLRGDPEHGIVESDYSLGENETVEAL